MTSGLPIWQAAFYGKKLSLFRIPFVVESEGAAWYTGDNSNKEYAYAGFFLLFLWGRHPN